MTKPIVPPAVGDEVYLKSGSQRMTIERVYDAVTDADGVVTQSVGVVWMKYGEHEIRRDTLPIAVLNFKGSGS